MKNKLGALGCLALSIFGICSCIIIDDSLDLDKELSLDMRLGAKGLYIPVGTLDTIWMDSLLKIDNIGNASVRHLDNGVLGIDLAGDIDSVSYKLKPVSIKIEDIEIPSCYPEFEVPQGVASAFVCRVSEETEIGIDTLVDDALVSVSSASFEQPAAISLGMRFSNLPASTDSVMLVGYRAVFPDFMNISYTGSDPRICYDTLHHAVYFDGKLSPSEIMASGDGLVIEGLSVNGLDFTSSSNPIRKSESGTRFVVDDRKMTIGGALFIYGKDMQLTELADVEMDTRASVGEFTISSVTGVVKPDIEHVNQAVALSLGSDLDFLFNPDNNLKISDMQIALSLKYTLPVDMSLSMSVMSKDRNGQILSGDCITPDDGDITIPGCSASGDTCNVTFLFYAKEEPVIGGADTIPVRISGLPRLLSVMPDSILFQLDADVAGTGNQTFCLTDLSLTGNYDVTIPLCFDEMTVVYNDTVADLGKDLEEVAKYVGKADARLEARYESNVPFGVVLNVWAIDSLKNMIPEVVMDSVVIPAGNETVLETETVGFELSVQEGGFEKIDGFVFSAKCIADGASVRSDGFILVKDVYLAFDEGLDVDLTDLIKKEDE